MARQAFLDGIKASMITAQINEIGMALCSGCGDAWPGSRAAFGGLFLQSIVAGPPVGYRGGANWGMDHPNNFRLVCRKCGS